VGNLKDGTVQFQDKTCRMGRHGFARNRDFTPVSVAEDTITYELRSDEATFAQYPFPFVLRITHRLLDDGFSTEFQVENPGSTPLPFCVGGHTAFRCPLLPGERFEDYQLVFEQVEDIDSPLLNQDGCIRADQTERFLAGTNTVPLSYSLFARIDTLIFRGLRSKNVRLVHRETGRGVQLDFSQFPMAAFWTKPGAPFLCLEPWHGCAAVENESGDFAQKPHAILLPAGEQKALSYRFRLLE
jgi:galactose mutarotase-like enzyme